MNYLKAVLVLVAVYLCSCVSSQSGYVTPGKSLALSSYYYVVKEQGDKRALNEVIAKILTVKGYSVTTGTEDKAPKKADYLIRYGSQWQWDITWYLLDFNIRVYAHANNQFVASAHSQQTSLVRKSHNQVVANSINQIFID